MSSSPVERAEARPSAGLQLSTPLEWNDVWNRRPPSPVRDTPIEVHVVGRRCVYVNARRIAGGKPYVSEGLPSHSLKTKLGDVLEAFTPEQIVEALAEKRATDDYFAAYRAAKAAAALSSEVLPSIPGEASTGNQATDEPILPKNPTPESKG